jgi:hypothetical protein
MARLAQQYGISGNGLAKICDRLKVSYPPRGYWAKLAAGQAVQKVPLAPWVENSPATATINPTPALEPEPELPAAVMAMMDKVRSAAVPVPERLTLPHKIIARWHADHERRKVEAQRERDPWIKKLKDPGELTAAIRRRHRILDALFKGVERNGGIIKEDDRHQLYCELHGEKIEFHLREKQKMVRGDNGSRQFQSTGKLVIAIKTCLPKGFQREWAETDEKPLDAMLPHIVATFVAASPVLAEQTAHAMEVRRKREIEEHKRYQAEQERKLIANRLRRFREFAQIHRDVGDSLAFLNALRGTTHETDRVLYGHSVAEWFERNDCFVGELLLRPA